jgi:putative transposase
VASAVNSESFREILGICEGAKEDKSGWSAFSRHPLDRGLKGVQLIISDVCRGLIESAAEYLPEARWQRRMVHFYRNVFCHVPATKIRDVSHMLKAIHAQESRAAADQKAGAIIEDLRASKMSKAADLVEQRVRETPTYYAFPDIHRQKIRTNNPLERIMRETRRRTRVVGAFPDSQSCLNLAAARLRYIAGTAWSTKCYVNMQPSYQPRVMLTEAVPDKMCERFWTLPSGHYRQTLVALSISQLTWPHQADRDQGVGPGPRPRNVVKADPDLLRRYTQVRDIDAVRGVALPRRRQCSNWS